jgi:hypothetical protein
MVKHSLRRKRTGAHSRRRMHGGQVAATAAAYTDGPSYVLSQYGTMDTQWNNVFGPNSTSTMGNEIVNLNHPQQTPANLYPMNGGKRRRAKGKGRKSVRRGGNLAYAVAPFALWGLQKTIGCRNKSRKIRRR